MNVTLARLFGAAAAGFVTALVVGALGIGFRETLTTPAAVATAVIAVGVVALVVGYGWRRARSDETVYW